MIAVRLQNGETLVFEGGSTVHSIERFLTVYPKEPGPPLAAFAEGEVFGWASIPGIFVKE